MSNHATGTHVEAFKQKQECSSVRNADHSAVLYTQGLKVTLYKALPNAFLPFILMSLFKAKCPFADADL